jgi:hypothetical protein
MTTPNSHADTQGAAEFIATVSFLLKALRMASGNFSLAAQDHGRSSVRIALVGIIKLLADLFPNEPSLQLPLNELLYALADLDRGKIAPLLKPAKVAHNPGNTLSEGLFRAIPAAAMDRLVAGKMSREEAARRVARSLSRMGYKNSSGAAITGAQVAKWRENMMAGRASEDPAVARYDLALRLVLGMQPAEGAQFMLELLPDLSLPKIPKNPPA